jgi:hypothetical protein
MVDGTPGRVDEAAPTATRERAAMARPTGTLAAFVAMAFLIVGLTGLFATFAAPLPLQRAQAREAALDQAEAAARSADPPAALARLQPQLGGPAPALMAGPDLQARIAAERLAMRARFAIESEVTLTRLRWLICVITGMGALFGVVMLNLAARTR